jgi:hypothetical protein
MCPPDRGNITSKQRLAPPLPPAVDEHIGLSFVLGEVE